MSLARIPRHVVKAIRVMSDPEPSFASLVPHGANQTPFAKLASEDGERDVDQPIASEETEDMTTPAAPRVRQRITQKAEGPKLVADLHRILFPATKTEEEVQTYLVDHGYGSKVKIEKTDDGWVANGIKADDFTEEPKPITLADGVVLYVGVLKDEAVATVAAKSDDGDLPTRALSQKTEDAILAVLVPSQKDGEGPEVPEAAQELADEAVAAQEETSTSATEAAEPIVAETLAAEDTPATTVGELLDGEHLVQAWDGWVKKFDGKVPTAKGDNFITTLVQYGGSLPPGYWQLQDAMSCALADNLREKDYAGVAKVAQDFANIVIGFTKLIETYPELDRDTVVTVFLSDENVGETTVKTEDQATSAPGGTEATPETPAQETVMLTEQERIDAAVQKALEPFLAEQAAQRELASKTIVEVIPDTASDVEVRQTRKGADEPVAAEAEAAPETTQKADKNKVQKYSDGMTKDPLVLGALGYYPRSSRAG